MCLVIHTFLSGNCTSTINSQLINDDTRPLSPARTILTVVFEVRVCNGITSSTPSRGGRDPSDKTCINKAISITVHLISKFIQSGWKQNTIAE